MTLDDELNICREATPGEWPNYYDEDIFHQIAIDGIARPAITPSDAKFIAHFNPDKVEKMLKVIERAKKLKPMQPSEVKLGAPLVQGYDELLVALEEAGYD